MNFLTKRLSPIVAITIGLVMMTCATLLAGDFFFSYLPDRDLDRSRERQRVAQVLAGPVVDLLSRGETDRLAVLLENAADQDPDLLSIGVRRDDGRLLVGSSRHPKDSQADPRAHLNPDKVIVPIDTADGPWGVIESHFQPAPTGLFAFLKRHPGLAALLTLVLGGGLSISLYMRRVLQQFDPNAVIPERVSAAFDVMTEGVAVIDAQGRIALVNKRLREIGGMDERRLTAVRLSNLPWLARALSKDPDMHPWHRSLRLGQRITGDELVVRPEDQVDDDSVTLRNLVVNCAPIADGSHRVRGCMVTFDDVSDLHRTNHELAVAMERLRESRVEIEHKAADLERLASVDYLTGVLNRRAFASQGEAMFEHKKLSRSPLACLMLDIDFFKRINDTFGHGVGDEVIRAVAALLLANTRERDLVGRFGGEEFCVLLPDTGASTARDMAEAIRSATQESLKQTVAGLKGREVTISVGMSVLSKDHASVNELIAAADEALYEAKGSGRNQVCMASSPLPA